MPRNVRNFWLELSVDGNASKVGTGPRAKDGGFELSILMRDGGGIKRALSVRGYEDNGVLKLCVGTNDTPGWDTVIETKR
jgi:hypothetical protein